MCKWSRKLWQCFCCLLVSTHSHPSLLLLLNQGLSQSLFLHRSGQIQPVCASSSALPPQTSWAEHWWAGYEAICVECRVFELQPSCGKSENTLASGHLLVQKYPQACHVSGVCCCPHDYMLWEVSGLTHTVVIEKNKTHKYGNSQYYSLLKIYIQYKLYIMNKSYFMPVHFGYCSKIGCVRNSSMHNKYFLIDHCGQRQPAKNLLQKL